ncbi:MAG: hypothetical protein ABFC88_13080 [Thermoguttaceae bacterium]
MSFYAKYWATVPGKSLIGGVDTAVSSRFGNEYDARHYLQTVLELQPAAQGVVLASGKYPEIFRHCPESAPQAIGGRCFECGKRLTVSDARQHRAID